MTATTTWFEVSMGCYLHLTTEDRQKALRYARRLQDENPDKTVELVKNTKSVTLVSKRPVIR